MSLAFHLIEPDGTKHIRILDYCESCGAWTTKNFWIAMTIGIGRMVWVEGRMADDCRHWSYVGGHVGKLAHEKTVPLSRKPAHAIQGSAAE